MSGFGGNSHASQVFHIWANQSKPEGKRGDGRVYFRGPAFYSFGSHYVAGYIMPDGVALFNDTKYSPTTSGHVSAARSAASHRKQYLVPELTELVKKIDSDTGTAYLDHVKEYALEFATDDSGMSQAAIYLLKVAKQPLAATRWQDILAAAIVKRDRQIAADAKAEIQKNRTYAKRTAALSDSEFLERAESMNRESYVSRNRRNDGVELHGRITNMSRDLLAWQKAAKVAGWTRIVEIISARRKIVKDMIALKLAKGQRKVANEYRKGQIKHIRSTLEKIAAGKSLRSWDYQRLAEAAVFVQEAFEYISAKGVASLTKLASDANAEYARILPIEEKAAEESRKIEAARRFEKEKEKREAWLAGYPGFWNGSDSKGGALLRVIGDNVETSHGANVPLAHAIKAFAFIKLVAERGKKWERNGKTVRVGHFQVDRIEANGDIKAGCHFIQFSELNRIAAAIGVANIPASDSAEEIKAA